MYIKAKAKGGKICPQCYISALILLLGGSSTIAFFLHPVTIAISIALGILAVCFMYRGYKKNGGKGGLQRNLTMTFLVISAFMFGYLFAAYQTHDYFKERTHHSDEEECETCSIENSNINVK